MTERVLRHPSRPALKAAQERLCVDPEKSASGARKREQLAVLNRLKELAQRQQDEQRNDEEEAEEEKPARRRKSA